MDEDCTIGLDIAKNVFQAHGADASGRQLFSRRLTRGKVLEFFAAQPRCVVALEACGGAHHWARELTILGHEVRLIPPAYVKPFVKRQKNDAADAEAICEAVQRPNMRFVAIKSEEQQASALVFRTRDLLVRQRTQTINAIRGHMAEYGWVAPKGPAWVTMLGDLIEDEIGSSLPGAARDMFRGWCQGKPTTTRGRRRTAIGGRRVWRTIGKMGSEKPGFALVPRARLSDLDPVRELPYRPAARAAQTGRTDDAP